MRKPFRNHAETHLKTAQKPSPQPHLLAPRKAPSGSFAPANLKLTKTLCHTTFQNIINALRTSPPLLPPYLNNQHNLTPHHESPAHHYPHPGLHYPLCPPGGKRLPDIRPTHHPKPHPWTQHHSGPLLHHPLQHTKHPQGQKSIHRRHPRKNPRLQHHRHSLHHPMALCQQSNHPYLQASKYDRPLPPTLAIHLGQSGRET